MIDTTGLHYILKMPSSLPEIDSCHASVSSVYNVVMVDVSGSMTYHWKGLVIGWNEHVAPKLIGGAVIYTFSSNVTWRKSGTTLEESFFDGGGTDLTGALQTIINEINLCKNKYVNVFIITDGYHQSTTVEPTTVIEKMDCPRNKTCNVFILGVGTEFPVQYSIDIRSRLHNGSPNIPSIYLSEAVEDMASAMESIGRDICDPNSSIAQLNVVGSLLPGLPVRNFFHTCDWVCLQAKPDQRMTLQVIYNRNVGTLVLEPQLGTMEVLMEIFKQWNSIIIQKHVCRETLPDGIMELKERLFKRQCEEICQGMTSNRARYHNKKMKALELNFREEVNKIKTVLMNEKFENPLQLAENILSTTVVTSKYRIKSLQLKGHTDKDFEVEKKKFLEVLNENKNILAKISITADDCCRIKLTSTISELIDEDFPDILQNYDKYSFLKTFSMTGIPVFAPVRDSIAVNPWSYSIQRILNAPYTIMSQSALEDWGDYQPPEDEHKSIRIMKENADTTFNAIVPVFPTHGASFMKPLVKTRIYAMCATFAITKTPHLIDIDIHMASLAVTWVKCLADNPIIPRPEHVEFRMKCIEATAALYMDERRFMKYCSTLIDDPREALMTESIKDKSVRCETLIKPIFFLHMMKNVMGKETSIGYDAIMKWILIEFIGRCLSGDVRNKSKKPYTTFFTKSLENNIVRRYINHMTSNVAGCETEKLLSRHYTPEDVMKAAKRIARNGRRDLRRMIPDSILTADVQLIEELRNVSTAGDISWQILQTFARHIGLCREAVDDLFSEENIFIYARHALEYGTSRDRMTHEILDIKASKVFVNTRVQEEGCHESFNSLEAELSTLFKDAWVKAYLAAHEEIVQPMTRSEIITEAQKKGVNVSEDSFDEVYKGYRQTGLLSNACQAKACPFYLQPSKYYNQHARVERKESEFFIHGLHHFTHQKLRTEEIVDFIVGGISTKNQTPVSEADMQKLYDMVRYLEIKYLEMKMEDGR